ncbi:MAG: ABC-type sugar transport system periplasmic component-like protein, partial [Pseudonocardiales bacterium]|nr:ABC-type sugar transport system periplasmic component-like protein [Pseudonocardiales bacterium]
TGASSSGAASGGTAAATKAVAAARGVPTWTAPGPPIDANKLKGKTIFVIPISESTYETQLEAAEKKAADLVGVTLKFYPNQGAVADWVKGMNAAIAAKPDLIFLESSPDPRQLSPQLQAAKAAGIPVYSSHENDISDSNPPSCVGCTNLDAVVKAPFSEGGKLAADWAINDSAGKADVLIVALQGLNAADAMLKGAKDEYATNCPKCKVKVVKLALTDISNGAITAVSTALSQDPSIKYINPQFDLLIPGTLASMQVSNRSSGIKVLSYNGTTPGLAEVANSKSAVAADVAEPVEWTAYANMDQGFRLLAGMAPVAESNPLRIFDKTNIAEAGGTPYQQGFGTAYATGWATLWGVAS